MKLFILPILLLISFQANAFNVSSLVKLATKKSFAGADVIPVEDSRQSVDFFMKWPHYHQPKIADNLLALRLGKRSDTFFLGTTYSGTKFQNGAPRQQHDVVITFSSRLGDKFVDGTWRGLQVPERLRAQKWAQNRNKKYLALLNEFLEGQGLWPARVAEENSMEVVGKHLTEDMYVIIDQATARDLDFSVLREFVETASAI